MTARACTREEIEATLACQKADKEHADLANTLSALIEMAAGRAPVALGVIRRAEAAIAVLQDDQQAR